MALIDYEDISTLFELDIKDKDFNMLCLQSACSEIEKETGFYLEEKEYTEMQTVRDNRIILDAIYVKEIESITDITVHKQFEHFSVDYENKSIYFTPYKTDGHIVLVVYKGGYRKETLPADLREAIIKLFLLKQKQLRKMNNGEELDEHLSILDEINVVIKRYSRKAL